MDGDNSNLLANLANKAGNNKNPKIWQLLNCHIAGIVQAWPGW